MDEVSNTDVGGRDGGQAAVSAPSISLPKGGGAIRGIGEKFASNPVTGTGAMTVPLAVSPSRSGFSPQLELLHNSGSGNGPFGLGWTLSLPAISRKTDAGLPQYRDAVESDVYIVSGAEDLVPLLSPDGTRFADTVTASGYTIHRYRPRTEGLFARIERWTSLTTGDTHWRSISRSNITTVYGSSEMSRIFDPNDSKRVFTWLISESYDDKGNAILYEYAGENGDNVDGAQANEGNRLRTANRYLKRIKYGNTVSRLIMPDFSRMEWMFEVVFDYDEGHYELLELDSALNAAEQHRYVRASVSAGRSWTVRPDPFTSCRSGFEVRTYRRCRRMLMFHRFAQLGSVPCLVRSTEFGYEDLDYSERVSVSSELAHQGSTRFASFLRTVTQSGYIRDETREMTEVNGTAYSAYLRKSMPSLEFEYSKAVVQEQINELEPGSMDDLPGGLDSASCQWVDLNGEGAAGILTEQAGAWYYKPSMGEGRFGPSQAVALLPSKANLSGGRQQLMDLAGGGQLDLVMLDDPLPGFYKRTVEEGWEPFRSFSSLPNIAWDDPCLRFIDLDGNGLADVLITEDNVFTCYASLGEEGFGPARHVLCPSDEEQGPRIVLTDGTLSVYIADMCGDGLADLVRIRSGEICYWPNLGYGRFGAKVTMDNAPRFDQPDSFDQRRIRLADLDGTGATDLIYLGRDGVRLYFNQCGNRWSEPYRLGRIASDDQLSGIRTADLLGNGTACLVWSTASPAGSSRQLRYIDLMGGHKPHLLTRAFNNLGAETVVGYASSSKFYLADKRAGKPWISKLPFPVHVVERVETRDRISGNRFVTRYAYHHGFFDGAEREFRGFGLVEQWDTEEISALETGQLFPIGTNDAEPSHVPPVWTRTWFHTGVWFGREHVSSFFAGRLDGESAGEYYREPGLTDTEARRLLLPDTVLPAGLSVEEEREACRALKGSELRREIYTLDGTDKMNHPYTVTERSFAVRRLQPQSDFHVAVFLTHLKESITYVYERNPADPRIVHTLHLETDEFGNVLKSATIGYGRRQPDPELETLDQLKQSELLITWTENSFTNAIDAESDYRAPLPSEARSYELTGLALPEGESRLIFERIAEAGAAAVPIAYEESPSAGVLQKRLIDHQRIIYRRDDLDGPLKPGELEPKALPFESFRLAFTPGLLAEVYGGRVTEAHLADEGRYVRLEGNSGWWIGSGRSYYSLQPSDTAAQELDYANAHFYLPHRYRAPFHTDAASTETLVRYDGFDLLVEETVDALGNRITVGERDIDPGKPLVRSGYNYRVLQPELVMDANRNRSAVVYDALGLVEAAAIMGKPEDAPRRGDLLDGFPSNMTDAAITECLLDPLARSHELVGRATTRQLYDMFAYSRTKDEPQPQPAVVCTLARETHDAELMPGEHSKNPCNLAYYDGFGREIQTKVQAEPGTVPLRDPLTGHPIIVGGRAEMTQGDGGLRWIGSGWTVFNNKGKPVRQYEPFYTDTHRFEFDVRIGVSQLFMYDPLSRLIGVLHPNRTWEKTVLGPWRQEAWDANDTVLTNDPGADPTVGYYFRRLPEHSYLPTWHAQRQSGALGAAAQAAAVKTAVHANTPKVVCFDSIGRAFLTIAHNRFKMSHTPESASPIEEVSRTRANIDIQGHVREIIDAGGRIAMRSDYNMAGSLIRQASMEAGNRWMLSDAGGKQIRGWDSRAAQSRIVYDRLRRPAESYLREAGEQEQLVERTVYGETLSNPEIGNLRGKAFQLYDQAGVSTSAEYDFKGNLLLSRRQLAREYKATLNWSNGVPLETEIYESRTRYNALNRVVELTAQDGSVIRPAYDITGRLRAVEANVRGAADATRFVSAIMYNAKGQRTRIDYGTSAGTGQGASQGASGDGLITTVYEYDPDTFRLVQLKTSRNASGFEDTDRPGEVQNYSYTYDPAGNITNVRDDASQTIYFRNRRVEPGSDYTYDAVYRLIEATGREHLGQTGGVPDTSSAPDPFDSLRTRLSHPGDGNAMATYIERYSYDITGNMTALQHRGSDALQLGWTRQFIYNEESQLEAGRASNRLSGTAAGGIVDICRYDGTAGMHGSITAMSHLAVLQWDYRDRLRSTARQTVGNGGTPETTWYVYDANGQRVRKVTERQTAAGQTPTRKSERIWLGGIELYREYGNDGTAVRLERETLHIKDDKQRIAVVETLVSGNDGSPSVLIRYQFGSLLGSSSLELDEQARILSYEEYTPYGCTSYQALRSQTETKRYRFTGRERDEESGLYYCGARYYAAWLGRWASCDPAGLVDGTNLYEYVGGNPINRRDPTGLQQVTNDLDPSNPANYVDFDSFAL